MCVCVVVGERKEIIQWSMKLIVECVENLDCGDDVAGIQEVECRASAYLVPYLHTKHETHECE